MPDTRRLVNAWAAWDEACAAISRRGEAASKRKPPKPYIPPRNALVREAAELVDAEVEAAGEMGIPFMRLVDRITAARRDGASIEEAVAGARRG